MGGPSLGKPKNAKEMFREWFKSQTMDAEFIIDDIDRRPFWDVPRFG